MKNNEVLSEEVLKDKIVYLNFICIIMVVFIHDNNIELYNLNQNNGAIVYYIEMFISENICLLAVPMFFALSGYLFYRNFIIDKLFDKWKSRIKSLIVPYVLWNLIYYFFYIFITNVKPIASFVNEQPVEISFLNLVQALLIYKYNYVFWFLAQLIIFVALCPLIYKLVKNRLMGGIVLLSILIVNVLKVNLPIINIESLLFYIIGAYLGIHFKEIFYKQMKTPLPIVLCYFACAEVVLGLSSHFEVIGGFKIFFKVLMIITVWLLINPKKIRVSWAFRNSFFIYCAHPYILETLKKIIYFLVGNSSKVALLNYIISPIITITVILTIDKYMEKHMPKTFFTLSGSRVR